MSPRDGWMMPPGLDALLAPRSRAEVLASIARDEPVVVHGLTNTVAALTALPFLASLEALLRSWPEQVVVHLPDLADEASSITAAPRDAHKLFANGMGLRFDDVHALSPVLEAWLGALRRDLGLSALTQGRCLVYATAAGHGTAAHCDQNINIVLQLSGTKTWWLAPNHHVSRPLTRHTMGLPMDAELASYAPDGMPSEMPADQRAIVLEAGSLLVVPRGMWHATDAATDAMSLNFTYSAPTWIDLVTAALRGRLAQSEAWRETAAPGDAATFEALLRELADDVPHWTAEDILAVTEADGG